MAYCGNYANQAVAFDVVGGKVAWTYEDRALPFFSAPAVNDRLVLIGSRDKHLHAIERQTGKPAWKFRTGGRVEGSPIVFEDGVVFGSSDGRLYAASLEAGTELWQLELGEPLVASPAFGDRQVVIGGEKGTVFAIRGGSPTSKKPEPPGRRKRQAHIPHPHSAALTRISRGTLLPREVRVVAAQTALGMNESPTPTAPNSVKTSTLAGNYFISNYPPFSFWSPEQNVEVELALNSEPATEAKLGVYHHIPFCRKRCHFCYFRVYTDKNAKEIQGYLDATLAELKMLAERPLIQGRKPHFVYFGGGTPSYLSAKQLTELTDQMKAILPWDEAREVAFECEPGTLNPGKLAAIKQIGVHAAQPRHREFRRPHPRNQRPRPPLG